MITLDKALEMLSLMPYAAPTLSAADLQVTPIEPTNSCDGCNGCRDCFRCEI